MLIIIVETSCSNDLTISLKIKKLISAKIRPGKSSVPLSECAEIIRMRELLEWGYLPIYRGKGIIREKKVFFIFAGIISVRELLMCGN